MSRRRRAEKEEEREKAQRIGLTFPYLMDGVVRAPVGTPVLHGANRFGSTCGIFGEQ